MGEIVHLNFKPEKGISTFLEKTKEAIEREDIDNIILACKLKDGRVMTGYCNVDVGGKMELIGHLQTDAMIETLKNRYTSE